MSDYQSPADVLKARTEVIENQLIADRDTAISIIRANDAIFRRVVGLLQSMKSRRDSLRDYRDAFDTLSEYAEGDGIKDFIDQEPKDFDSLFKQASEPTGRPCF
jgi:hypothetical protein